MEFRETLLSAARTLRSHKLRSALTMLGVVIATGSLVALMSLISGLNRSVAVQFQSLGTEIISVSIWPWIQVGDSDEYRHRKHLTIEDSEAVRELPAVGLVAPNVHTGRRVTYEGERLPMVQISGSTPEYQTIDAYSVEAGRFLTRLDVERRRRTAVLGRDVADELFGARDPIGRDIRLGSDRFRVAGVLEPKGSLFGNSLDELVIIPITTFEKEFGRRRSVVIDCQPAEGYSIDETIDSIRQLLRIRRKVPRGEPDDFAINTQSDLLDQYRQLTGILFGAMLGVVSLALLVGGIGIMNVMLVSVAERTREIGIRKAIGARRRDIIAQFVVEAIILTGIGGAIGMLGGSGLGGLVALLTPLPATVTPGSIMLAAGFSVFTGLVFGVYPALRAGGLSPIEALSLE